jgi:hypothetical protein
MAISAEIKVNAPMKLSLSPKPILKLHNQQEACNHQPDADVPAAQEGDDEANGEKSTRQRREKPLRPAPSHRSTKSE